jgi:hypothetical protein
MKNAVDDFYKGLETEDISLDSSTESRIDGQGWEKGDLDKTSMSQSQSTHHPVEMKTP